MTSSTAPLSQECTPQASRGASRLEVRQVLQLRLAVFCAACDDHAASSKRRRVPDLDRVSLLLISGEDGAGSGQVADAFLPKPFNSQQLLAALEGLLPDGSLNP